MNYGDNINEVLFYFYFRYVLNFFKTQTLIKFERFGLCNIIQGFRARGRELPRACLDEYDKTETFLLYTHSNYEVYNFSTQNIIYTVVSPQAYTL